MSRFQDRGDLPDGVRIRMLEKDADELEAQGDALRGLAWKLALSSLALVALLAANLIVLLISKGS